MLRKWSTLAAVMTAVTLTATGLSLAADESPLEKLMEKVGSKSNAIKKAIRTPVAYKKAQKDLAKYAEELAQLGKDAREIKGPSEKQKKSFEEWQKLCDDYVAKTESFKDLVAKSSTTQAEAKKAWGPVNTSCTSCHSVFRVDEEK